MNLYSKIQKKKTWRIFWTIFLKSNFQRFVQTFMKFPSRVPQVIFWVFFSKNYPGAPPRISAFPRDSCWHNLKKFIRKVPRSAVRNLRKSSFRNFPVISLQIHQIYSLDMLQEFSRNFFRKSHSSCNVPMISIRIFKENSFWFSQAILSAGILRNFYRNIFENSFRKFPRYSIKNVFRDAFENFQGFILLEKQLLAEISQKNSREFPEEYLQKILLLFF